jgi:hypothetical protein
MRPRRTATAIVLAASLFGTLAIGQSTPATVRLRGTVQAVSPGTLTLKERGGEVIELVLSDKLVVSEVYPIALEDIKPGSFIGTAAMPQQDGSQRAIAVTVFPESARGTGEGHRPFDLQPQSTMTNATVADVVAAPAGRTLQLKYKDGEKTIQVPQGAPIVTFKPADRSLLVPGASVSLAAQVVDGKPTATRVNAGRNGFALPY